MRKIFVVISILFSIFLVYFTFQIKREIKFEEVIYSDSKKEFVWNYLEAALMDSQRIGNWPNELSTLNSNEVAIGETLYVAYRSPWFKKQVEYEFSFIKPGDSLIYITTPKHPLDGGGAIKIRSQGDSSTLVWSGNYEYRGMSLAALYFKYYFKDKFFSRLRAAIKDLE